MTGAEYTMARTTSFWNLTKEIRENPFAQREWTRIRRRWVLWGSVSFAMVALIAFQAYAGRETARVAMTTGTMSGWFFISPLLLLINLFLIDFLIVFWIALSLERERQNRSWEQLKVAPVTLREIALGMTVLPMFLGLIHGGASGIVAMLSIFDPETVRALGSQVLRDGIQTAMTAKIIEFAMVPLTLLSRILSAFVVALIVFWVCRRRAFVRGVVKAIFILILLTISISMLFMILFFLIGLGTSLAVFEDELIASISGAVTMLIYLIILLGLAKYLLRKIDGDTGYDLTVGGP